MYNIHIIIHSYMCLIHTHIFVHITYTQKANNTLYLTCNAYKLVTASL